MRDGGAAVGRWMSAILAAQIAIAAILFGGDVASRWEGSFRPSSAPDFDAPVRPGDQTRRYSPARPGATPLPSTADMPSRLRLDRDVVEDRPTLRLTGNVAPGDADRVIDALAEARPEIVALDSPGGSVRDALTIGRALREAGLDTLVGAEAVCLSSCPYMLAGGPDRTVHPEGIVGVHQHYFGANSVLPAFMAVEDIQRGQGEVMAYLEEMGIDLRLMQHALLTPPGEIYVLVPTELAEYRVTTIVPGDE